MFSVRRNFLQTSLKSHPILQLLQPTLPKLCATSKPPNLLLQNSPHQSYSTEKFASKNADIFGDLSGHKFEEFPMDPDEQEQESFEKNEGMVARRLKLSKGQYADLIKEHITKGDLDSALEVLDLVKDNRDKPTTYQYTLLLRAFAVQGNLKKTWKLFTQMKKRALKLNAATYVSVINACANTANSEVALEYLDKIREEISQKDIVLNQVHYNAFVKAYGRHRRIVEAFKIVDQMIDKKMTIDESTFNSLLYACNSDKENGLRHALVVWHMMQRWRKKPSLLTFNLILRAIRDTRMGQLQSNEILLTNYQASRILISDSLTPDLLANPPVVSNILKSGGTSDATEMKSGATSSLAMVADKCEVFRLEDIHQRNKLILFGGFNGFMKRMEADHVEPDEKTMTLLLDLVPNSLAIERKLIETARTKKISLDIDFFNMLIKKRSFRKDYKEAKEVLDDIQRHNLVPNMITWGVLALGCHTLEEAKILIEGIETTGHTLNTVIAGSLLGNACCGNRIAYILEIMQIVMYQRIRPSKHIYAILDQYKAKYEDVLKHDRSSKLARNEQFRQKFETFKNRYEKMQVRFSRTENEKFVKPR